MATYPFPLRTENKVTGCKCGFESCRGRHLYAWRREARGRIAGVLKTHGTERYGVQIYPSSARVYYLLDSAPKCTHRTVMLLPCGRIRNYSTLILSDGGAKMGVGDESAWCMLKDSFALSNTFSCVVYGCTKDTTLERCKAQHHFAAENRYSRWSHKPPYERSTRSPATKYG